MPKVNKILIALCMFLPKRAMAKGSIGLGAEVSVDGSETLLKIIVE